jgi:hypothetical protein
LSTPDIARTLNGKELLIIGDSQSEQLADAFLHALRLGGFEVPEWYYGARAKSEDPCIWHIYDVACCKVGASDGTNFTLNYNRSWHWDEKEVSTILQNSKAAVVVTMLGTHYNLQTSKTSPDLEEGFESMLKLLDSWSTSVRF